MDLSKYLKNSQDSNKIFESSIPGKNHERIRNEIQSIKSIKSIEDFKLFTPAPKSKISPPDGLKLEDCQALNSIWFFFWISRIFGVIPVRSDFQRQKIWRNPYWICTGIAGFTQIFLLGMSLEHLTRYKLERFIEPAQQFLLYGLSLFNLFFMAFGIGKLKIFFKECQKVEMLLEKLQAPEKVSNFFIGWTLVFLVVYIADVTFYFYSFGLENNTTGSVQIYLEAYDKGLDTLFSDTPTLWMGFFILVGDGFQIYFHMFGVVFFMFLSETITQYLARMNLVIEKSGHCETGFLEKLRKSHLVLVNLIQLTNELFSPFIMAGFIGNVGQLFLTMFKGYSTDIQSRHWVTRILGLFEVLIQLFKIFLPSYFAAFVHREINKTLALLQNWASLKTEPRSDQHLRLLSIERFVGQLNRGEIGISPSGYFLITKSFLIHLASSLFTYELILLQFQTALSFHR